MISRSSIEKVKDTARVEEVVGDFVVLKKRGANLLGLCPFHNEKSPSFNVNSIKGIYKCFGCGKAGDSVRFVMDYEKLTYPDAIRYLAKKYNIDLEEEVQPEEAKIELAERESMLLVNQFAAEFFEKFLWETEEGQSVGYSYLKERGFTNETIKKFQLGMHPSSWSGLIDAAKSAGYNLSFLIKTGLAIENESKLFDRFRGRMMFPIHNITGKVIGFGGRILINDKKQAKYVNSPESEVYHKSAVLYGIHLARKAMITEDLALLVEGYTDVISLHQAGVENVVASSGTSLTTEQIRVIQRYTKNVSILFDGDNAGIKASFRGIDMILEQGLNVKIVLFPDGDDPDSFSKKNSPLFVKNYIKEEAKDFLSFKIDLLQNEVKGDPIKTAEMIREIIHTLSLIPDPIVRALYIKECAMRLEIAEQMLINELNRLVVANRKKQNEKNSLDDRNNIKNEDSVTLNNEENKVEETKHLGWAQELDLARILIKYANQLLQFQELDENKKQIEIQIRVGDFIVNELLNDGLLPENIEVLKVFDIFVGCSEGDFPEDKFFMQHEDETIARFSINLCSEQHALSSQWQELHKVYVTNELQLLKKMVLGAVYSFKLRKVQNMIDELNINLQNNHNEEENLATIEQIVPLQKAKMEFAKQLSYVIV